MAACEETSSGHTDPRFAWDNEVQAVEEGPGVPGELNRIAESNGTEEPAGQVGKRFSCFHKPNQVDQGHHRCTRGGAARWKTGTQFSQGVLLDHQGRQVDKVDNHGWSPCTAQPRLRSTLVYCVFWPSTLLAGRSSHAALSLLQRSTSDPLLKP